MAEDRMAPGHLTYTDLPDPEIEQPSDVIIRVGGVGICGSDIHGYQLRDPIR